MPSGPFLCNAGRFLPLSCLQFSCQIRMCRAVPFSLSCRALLHTVMSGESLTLPCRVNPSTVISSERSCPFLIVMPSESPSLSCRALPSHCYVERIPFAIKPSDSLLSVLFKQCHPLSYMGITPLCHVERAERVETSTQRVRNPACFTNLQLLCIFSIRIQLRAADD